MNQDQYLFLKLIYDINITKMDGCPAGGGGNHPFLMLIALIYMFRNNY